MSYLYLLYMLVPHTRVSVKAPKAPVAPFRPPTDGFPLDWRPSELTRQPSGWGSQPLSNGLGWVGHTPSKRLGPETTP